MPCPSRGKCNEPEVAAVVKQHPGRNVGGRAICEGAREEEKEVVAELEAEVEAWEWVDGWEMVLLPLPPSLPPGATTPITLC